MTDEEKLKNLKKHLTPEVLNAIHEYFYDEDSLYDYEFDDRSFIQDLYKIVGVEHPLQEKWATEKDSYFYEETEEDIKEAEKAWEECIKKSQDEVKEKYCKYL